MAAIELFSTPLFSDASLIYYTRLENNQTDSSSNNNTGSLGAAPSFAGGKFGQGISLVSASKQYVTFPHISAYNVGTGGFTVNLWHKRATTGNFGGLISDCDGSDLNGFRFVFDSTDKLGFVCANASTSDNLSTTQTITDTTTFHMLTATRDGSKLRIYVDGVADVTTATDNAKNVASTNALTLGPYRSGDLTANFIGGITDDASFFSRALSATEVSNLFNGTWPRLVKAFMLMGVG